MRSRCGLRSDAAGAPFTFHLRVAKRSAREKRMKTSYGRAGWPGDSLSAYDTAHKPSRCGSSVLQALRPMLRSRERFRRASERLRPTSVPAKSRA